MASAQDLEAIRAGKEAALRVKTTMKELGFSVAADSHTDRKTKLRQRTKLQGKTGRRCDRDGPRAPARANMVAKAGRTGLLALVKEEMEQRLHSRLHGSRPHRRA